MLYKPSKQIFSYLFAGIVRFYLSQKIAQTELYRIFKFGIFSFSIAHTFVGLHIYD